MTQRKPHHASHATNATTGEVDQKAVAAEMRHVADLLDAGLVEVRNLHEGAPDTKGWTKMGFERKLHPTLTEGDKPATASKK